MRFVGQWRPAVWVFFYLILLPCTVLSSDTTGLSQGEQTLRRFADPSSLWGQGLEASIESAYRRCFKTYILQDRLITVRMPFAQNNERSQMAPESLQVRGAGKADPGLLWTEINRLLESDDFNTYAQLLSDGKEKVLRLDMAARNWIWTSDLFDLAGMKALVYSAPPHRPAVLVDGKGLREQDVYNYLYAIGRVGMDCSGFVWHVLSATAAEQGIDLEKNIRQSIAVPPKADLSLYLGTWFFDSDNPALLEIEPFVSDLRPGDILLFRGEQGQAVHSAIIQSVDIQRGKIRYLQSTDEAPQLQRGVHDSFIFFDPGRADLSLKDYGLSWTQKRSAPFTGEQASLFPDDGTRFRAYPEHGAGKVVRLKVLSAYYEQE